MQDLEIIKNLFKTYSIKDIATTLFAMDMWLPNISSMLKMDSLYASFLSLSLVDFSDKDIILSYNDFTDLCHKIIKDTPSFSGLEDFVPVSDRGEVKVTINEKNYNLLYGSEIDNIYDRVESYKVIYDGPDKSIFDENPIDDLISVLEYQTFLVNNLQSCCSDVSHITTGHFESPSEEFFTACKNFLEHNYYGSIRECFITQVGEINYDSSHNVIDDVFDNKFLVKLFLKSGSIIFPIMPRRFTEVIIQYWGEYIKGKLSNEDFRTKLEHNITFNACKYLKHRFHKEKLILINNCFDISTKKNIGVEFFGSIISKDKKIMFYNIPLSYFQNKGTTLDQQKTLLLESSKHILTNGVLYDHINKNGIQLKNINEDDIVFVGILPIFTLDNLFSSTPKDYPGYIWGLTDFVSIIDGDFDDNAFGDFFEREKENKSTITSSVTDLFISFKNMNNVPIQGAIEPDMIYFDHTIGNNHRYEELSKFRSYFPDINPLGINPRSRKLEINHEMPVITSKVDYGVFFGIVKIKNFSILIHAPIDEEDRPSEQQLKCYEIIMQCISYYLQEFSDELGKVTFFNQKGTLQISVFCKQHVQDKEIYKHIEHLMNDNYKIDNGRFKYGYYGLRLLFDYEYCIAQFSKDTNEGELELIQKVLISLKDLTGEKIPTTLQKKLDKLKGQKPGFKIHYTTRIPFAFPGYVDPMLPEDKHYLKAKKEISKILLDKGIKPGIFVLEDGKNLINIIKKHIIDYINGVLITFSLEKNLPFLISRFDALLYKNWMDNQQFMSSNERLINYDPVEVFSQEERKFLDHVRNYRYCLEKFILLNSKNTKVLTKDDFQFIVALIDWLLAFQQASDILHNVLFTSGITIKNDFVFDITYSENIEDLSKKYSEIENKIRIGQMGNSDLKIETDDKTIIAFLDEINKGFKEDLGFSLDDMMKILQVLSLRGHFMGKKEYDEYNVSTTDLIFNEIIKEEKWIDRGKFDKIIDFLTLKPDEILTTYNSQDGKISTHADIPIWEHIKRFARYHLRPLINLGNNIYWGAINTKKTMDVWNQDIQIGRLPIYYKFDKTIKIVEKYKAILDKKLEDYVFEKTKALFPNSTEKNFEFIKRDPKSNPSHDCVGDYDVICYDDKKNILWLFECKEIGRPYSLKDSRRVRDDIFGKYLPKIITREDYMKKNIQKLNELTKWTVKNDVLIKSVYISSYNYWWTQYPTHKTNVEFITLKLLYDKIEGKI